MGQTVKAKNMQEKTKMIPMGTFPIIIVIEVVVVVDKEGKIGISDIFLNLLR